MTISRYARTFKLFAGRQYGTPRAATLIYAAVESGRIASQRRFLQGEERLDVIAGREYGNARLWWVIAAASGIGWAMQAPAGTMIRIPNLDQVGGLVG